MTKNTTAMKIAEDIATMIGRGILHPGQHLVENNLAERFETSRAPIREALLMLERDHLVQRVPHQGVVVRNFSREEIHDLYDVIYRLEEIAMEKAVSRLTSFGVKQLKDILQHQKTAVKTQEIQRYYDLNETFHNEIFNIAGNPVLNDLYQSSRRAARPFRYLSMAQEGNLQSSFEEHCRQVEALEAKDLASAKRAIREQEIRSIKSLDLLFPKQDFNQFRLDGNES